MSQEIFFHTDRDLRINSWGEAISLYTGKTPDTSLGNRYYEIMPPILHEGKDALVEAIDRNKAISIKGRRIACLFGHIYADIDVLPQPSVDGVDRVKVVLYPSTTCTVAQQLRQSQKLINIGKIASTLAHGVRNPLNAIKGAVVYLSEKYWYEKPLVEFTKIMEDEILRLENFITNFLSSSISDTAVRVTDVNSLLKRIEVLTSLQIFTRNINAMYEFGNIPPITINAFHLEQAILNVMNNAIEAMTAGGKLNISTYTKERDGVIYVVIAISDTGLGMAERAPGDLPIDADDNNNGRGFGLFITCEILKHYGGRIEVRSELNVGTTVLMFIPCQHAT